MLQTHFGIPGQTAGSFTATNEFIWGGDVSRIQVVTASVVVDGASRDAANTPTTVLRPGLLMGKVTSTGKYKQYDATATDGTEIPVGVLPVELVVVDPLTGTDTDKLCPLVVSAPLRAKSLYILGAAFVGHAGEFVARRALAANGRCLFDDDIGGSHSGVQRASVKATNYTVTAADNGTLFVAITADASFTLPTIRAGLEYEFLRASDHELVVASAAGDDMVVGNDLSADSVTWTTAGQQIGARLRIRSLYVNGTLKWLPEVVAVPYSTGAFLASAIAT